MSATGIIKKLYQRSRNLFGPPSQNNIVQFKKEIWQTDKLSEAFIKGTDANTVVAADMMNKEVNEFFYSNCLKTDRVLDIGCGHGIVSEYLAERGIQVAAVDISEKLLADLSSRIKGKDLPIEIKQGDAYNIPFEGGMFDVVVARMFLPHFPDWRVVLKEMTRVTKPGGKLLVHFSSGENTTLGKKIALQDCKFASSPNTDDPWKFYAEADDQELNKVSSGMGLQVLKRTPVSFFLHNRIFGYQLGTEKYNEYMEKIQQFFENEKVRDFAIWLDKEIIANCSPALSHFNIITFKKIS